LPASQDIVELLARKPRPVLAGLLGTGLLALLIEIGQRNVYEFVYFKF
jgi:alginate O-acetyltransferase complex protein AlgI